MFITTLWENPLFFALQIFVVVVSVCFHELAHAWVALKEGDPTAAEQGHLTLNPLKQMGPWSLVLLALVGLAWGQVPVNPGRMRRKISDMIVSLAGPLTNLALFFVFATGYGICQHFQAPQTAQLLFFLGGVINIILFVINILPVPGFDGWHVFSHFFPQILQTKAEVVGGISIFLVLLVLVFLEYIQLGGMILTNLWADIITYVIHFFINL